MRRRRRYNRTGDLTAIQATPGKTILAQQLSSTLRRPRDREGRIESYAVPSSARPSNDHVVPRLAYRPKDAALVLGVSRSTIYEMIAAGVLQARKLGSATLIPHDELTAVLASAAVVPVAKVAQASIS